MLLCLMSRPKKTETDEAFRGKGFIVSMGDAARFAHAIDRLAEKPEEREKLGMTAREFAVNKLDRKKILSKCEKGHDLK